jgi:hypothetical protein
VLFWTDFVDANDTKETIIISARELMGNSSLPDREDEQSQ